MKEIISPVIGFKVLEAPDGTPKRLDVRLDQNGLEMRMLKGVCTEKITYSLDQVSSFAEKEKLILNLNGDQYVLQTKKPERIIAKIDAARAKAKEKAEKARAKAAKPRCVVCNKTCKQCGGNVCPTHSNYVNGATYCHRCLVLCPKCKSAQISAHKGGFETGSAVLGWALGSVVLGALLGTLGMNRVELVCHTCGHRWAPRV